MAKYGVPMLEKLVLRYCSSGGSSRGMREFLEKRLPKLSAAHQQLEVQTQLTRGRHPQAVGLYIPTYCQGQVTFLIQQDSIDTLGWPLGNGRSKPICLKNLSSCEIYERVEGLRTCHGRGMEYQVVRARKLSRNPSIQGTWNVDTFAAQLERINAARLAQRQRMSHL